MMIPDSKGRLESAVQNLRAAVDELEGEDGVPADAFTEARAVLAEAALKLDA